jgi:Putative DNA-binding domain
MPSPVVVDGRVDDDKLSELLAVGAEQQALDYKTFEDLGDDVSRLDLVKDMLALSNSGGGFIVIGVEDDGTVASGLAVDRDRWDSAELVRQVRSYTQLAPNITSAVHERDGRTIILIAVDGAPEGLPIPFSQNGHYGPRSQRRFNKGEIWHRQGTENTLLDYAHWPQLLARYRARLVDENARSSEQLIGRVLDAIDRRDPCPDEPQNQSRPGPSSPLVPGSSWLDLDRSLAAAAENSSTVRVQRYLEELQALGRYTQSADDATTQARYLDEIAHVAISGARYGRTDIYDLALSSLYLLYDEAPVVPDNVLFTQPAEISVIQFRLDISVRAFVIGSYLVRRNAFDLIPRLVLHPVETAPWYTYASWLRHASVYAARANLLLSQAGGERGGLTVSLARQAAVEVEALRPDLSDIEQLDNENANQRSDRVLDSLCQFDFAALIVVLAEPEGDAGYYPASSAFTQSRTQPVIDKIASDTSVRRALLPKRSDVEISALLIDAISEENNASREFGFNWTGRPSSQVQRFVDANPPAS